MPRASKIVCPHCGAALRSGRGVEVGRTVPCPECSTRFTVRAQEVPEEGPSEGQANGGRVNLVLLGALLYLAGGAALAYYCFERNARPPEVAAVHGNDPFAGEDEKPATPRRQPTVVVSAAEQRKIDDAIARGAWYLRDRQLPDGTWGSSVAGPDWPGISVGLACLRRPLTLGGACFPARLPLRRGTPSAPPRAPRTGPSAPPATSRPG